MEVQQCQIRTVGWMWKNFPAPGDQEIHSCGSTVRSSTVIQKKNSESCGQQSCSLAPNSLLSLFKSFLTSSCIYCRTGRCEINQKNSVNIPETVAITFLGDSLS
jgi:hypothetical protein